MGLSTNDEITVENLLYGLLLKSGNDAAVALAEHIGGNLENFALMMNNKATELNLRNTNFVTPHGLDNENHYTSALDLAFLTDYALCNKIFAKIVNTKVHTILINNRPKTISNTNELLGNFDGIYGVKTGFTNGANRCLITSCKRGDLDFICVVLGCDTKKDRTIDSIKLLNYSFKNYSIIDLKSIAIAEFTKWRTEHVNSFVISKGKTRNLNLYLDETDFSFSSAALKYSEKDSINVVIHFKSNFNAPLKENIDIGKLVLYVGNDVYYSIDILNKNEIIRKSAIDYILHIFKNYCTFFNTTN